MASYEGDPQKKHGGSYLLKLYHVQSVCIIDNGNHV